MNYTAEILARVRCVRPLVHHITNWVTISDCAQAARAAGALPVMAHAEEEAADMAALCSALVLNIGTLTPSLVQSMLRAAQVCSARNVPVILDAVGAGATPLRTQAAQQMIRSGMVTLVKGNAAEIATLAGAEAEVRGVESICYQGDLPGLCLELSRSLGIAVCATGPEDIVCGAGRKYLVANGHPLMGEVVGTGCMAGSVIAAFCAVSSDAAEAAAHALACYGAAGESAAGKAAGPGSFKAALFDALAAMDESVLSASVRLRCL